MDSTTNSHKIFDDYEVECNECQKYWLDQCDGVKPDTTRQCTSFVATRNMDIPHKIKKLDEKVKTLDTAVTILNVVLTLHLLVHVVGAFIK